MWKKKSRTNRWFILRQLGHLLLNKIRRFLSLPHGRFGFIGIKFDLDFFGRAFNTFKSESRFKTVDRTDFQEENSMLCGGNFKGLSPSITPFWKENVLLILLTS